jgi:hypothetical protein
MALYELESSLTGDLHLQEFALPPMDLAKSLGPGVTLSDPPVDHLEEAVPQGRDLSTLCKACQSIFTQQRPGQVIHHGVDALRARAGRGCQLCLTIYMSMDPNHLLKFQKSTPNSQGIASFNPISRDQARLQFRYIPATTPDHQSTRSTGSARNPSMSIHSMKDGSIDPQMISVDLILVRPECEYS